MPPFDNGVPTTGELPKDEAIIDTPITDVVANPIDDITDEFDPNYYWRRSKGWGVWNLNQWREIWSLIGVKTFGSCNIGF